MTNKSFAHLHTHSEFSILDGAARVKDLVKAAVDDGQPAIATTDHGNMYGVVDMYKECEKQGIKYIAGIEVYTPEETVDERPPKKVRGEAVVEDDSGGMTAGGKKVNYHLTLLAENNTGYKNLIQLSSRAYLEGFYKKARCDWSMLEQHSEGVIATTGCLGGQVLQALMRGDTERAYTVAGRLQDIFGKDNLFVELQDHGIPEQRRTLSALFDVATKIGAPLLLANDCFVDGTLVSTSRGLVPIEQVVIGDKVQTIKGRMRPVTDVFSRDLNHKDDGLWDVIARVGRVALTGTGNHKVRVANFAKFKKMDEVGATERWVKIKDLEPGLDYLTIPKQPWLGKRVDSLDLRKMLPDIETIGTRGCTLKDGLLTTKGRGSVVRIPARLKVDEELMFFLGFYVANGCADKDSYRVSVSTNVNKMSPLDRIGEYLKQFGISPKIKVVGEGAELAFSSKVFNSLLPLLCGSGAGNKKIPGDHKWWDEEQFLIFCQGWFAGDGCKSNGRLSVSTTSKDLIYSAAARLTALGMPVMPAYGGAAGKAHNPKWAQVWTFGFTGSRAEAVEKALLSHKMPKGQGSNTAYLDIGHSWAVGLKKIVPAKHYSGKVHDLTVEGDHSYTANLWGVSNCHYVHQHDALSHDALLCTQTGSRMSDPNRFKFHGDQHYLKSALEMRSLFPEHPEASDNTLWIADRCNVTLDFNTPHMPRFPVPDGFIDDTQYLTSLVLDGANERWGAYDDDTLARLAYELKVIGDMGFSSYFLIMWDLVQHANKMNIRLGPARGSAGASAVLYALGVTKIDPIKYDLPFERFLNPSRVSMPDVDQDMSPRGREELIRYTAEKYGQDHVAQIITFGRIRGRSAVRDATRVLDKPYLLGSDISKALPPMIMGEETPLWACFEESEEYRQGYGAASGLRDLRKNNPEAREIIEVALGLEDLRRQDGIHAAAVVISDKPLTDYLPIQRKPLRDKEGTPGPITTQYEMHAVEDLGLLKMDYLGLRNLDVITDCLAILEQQGRSIDIDTIPLDDVKTFQMLRKGETIGVFQLESRPMQELIKRLRPTTFDDIAALVALYRPGPMAANMHNDYADRKNDKQAVTYFHPDAEEILGKTQGLMIFQESVMKVAEKFAGYSLAEADNLRRAMGKKVASAMAAEKDKFIAGCITNGYTELLATGLFETIEKFASYAFCSAHSYGYGLISYQTAYLKANFPAEYMASLCSSVDKVERIGFFLSEARAMGIKVNVPDINRSQVSFTVVDDEILVGLSAIAGVGDLLGTKILEARGDAPFVDVWDFAKRIVPFGFDKTRFSNIINSGCFDALGYPRLGLSGMTEDILVATRKDLKKNPGGAQLFADTGTRIAVPDYEYTPGEKLKLEKDLMGLYVTGHPLDSVESWIKTNCDGTLGDIPDWPVEDTISLAVVVTDVKTITTRKGDEMARITVEDRGGTEEVTVFNKVWMKIKHHFNEKDFLCSILCRVNLDEDGNRELFLLKATPKEGDNLLGSVADRECKLYLPEGFQNDADMLARLRGLTLGNRGNSKVVLYLTRKAKMELPKEHRVEPTEKFFNGVKELFNEYQRGK